MLSLSTMLMYLCFFISVINTLLTMLFTRAPMNVLNDENKYLIDGCLDQKNYVPIIVAMVFAISNNLSVIISLVAASAFGMNRINARERQELPELTTSLTHSGVNVATITRRAQIVRILPLPLILFLGSLLPSASSVALSSAIHLLKNLLTDAACLFITAADIKMLDRILYSAVNFSKLEFLVLGLIFLTYESYIRFPLSLFFNNMRPNDGEEQGLLEAPPAPETNQRVIP